MQAVSFFIRTKNFLVLMLNFVPLAGGVGKLELIILTVLPVSFFGVMVRSFLPLFCNTVPMSEGA